MPVLEATDFWQAEWLANRFDHRFLYDLDAKLWHVYDPETGLWRIDSRNVIREIVPMLVRETFAQHESGERELKTDGQRKALLALYNNEPVRRALDSLGTITGYKIGTDEWDQHPHLLGTASGVVDLRTGEVVKPERARDLHLSMSTGVPYTPGLTPRRFLEHMELVQPDPVRRAYLLRTFGYMLTGETGEQLWWFWYGPKAANGKSQTADIVRLSLGEYGANVPPALFTRDKFKKAIDVGSSLHALRSVRMGDMAELSHVAELDSELLKRMVEGAAAGIPYRPPYGGRDLMARPPTKLIGHGNSRPEVTDSNNGFWRRVRVVPWDQVVPEDRRIRDFGMKLVAEEGEAILSLLVREAVAYYANGLLPEPGDVAEATNEYRATADHFALWLNDDVLVTGLPRDTHSSSDAWTAYDRWCDAQGIRTSQRLDGKEFKARLEGVTGVTWKKTNKGNVFVGVQLPGRQQPPHLTLIDGEAA